MEEAIKVSVREITDFLCRSGSLDSWSGVKRMVEGTRLHNIFRSRAGAGYVKEVTLKRKFFVDGCIFELSGRADGIIDEDDGYTIDEIKTTTLPLRMINEEDFPAYRAQVECYACIFALDKNLKNVRTRLTFINVETEDFTFFYREHSTEELLERVKELLIEYKKWILLRNKFSEELLTSASRIKFPFKEYRDGQSDLILAAYRAFKNRERLFSSAPTGIGKTISVIYPAFRALGDKIGRRIFYLTSKTTLKNSAVAAVNLLRRKGLRTRSIVLTAKEKCCLCKEAGRECDSVICEYSEGHFGRVNEALYDILSNYECFDQPLIEEYAKKYTVCPYELSLDIVLWCDFIVCDYNYLFDSKVMLRRFFSDECDPEENLLLIDEAHNLAERSREIFSSELYFKPFLSLLKKIPESDIILYHPLRNLCRSFLSLKKRAENDPIGVPGFCMSERPYEAFGADVENFAEAAREWLRFNRGTQFAAEVSELRFSAIDYTNKLAFAERAYTNYVECREDETKVKLLSLDPSELLSGRLDRCRGAVLFSATLTPIDYFAEILGGGEKKATLELDSPFPTENLFIAAMDRVSTRYLDRAVTISAVAEILRTVVHSKVGNYIVYFPSYNLMKNTAEAFKALDNETKLLIQKLGMNETQRDTFLRSFKTTSDGQSMLAFAVLGGVFGEGIDLVGDRLIGSIIVGVGLARLNTETNIIANYYNENGIDGYSYAYAYPGMNKVLQAAGRVIRTDSDRGIVILIDDRFSTPQYVSLFPSHWRKMRLIGDIKTLSVLLKKFWDKK